MTNNSPAIMVMALSMFGLVALICVCVGIYFLTAAPTSSDPGPSVGPAVSTPEVKTPEVKTPEVKTPEVKTPEVEPIEVKTPEVETPEVKPTGPEPTPGVRPGTPDPAFRYRVGVEGAQVRGPEDAPVTLVLFYDLECPFCKRVNKSIDEVTAHYGKDVRIAYMHNPLTWHKSALSAAKALEAAAEQGKFLEMHGLLYEDIKSLTRQDFDAHARKLGLNKARFDKVFDDPATERRIKSQQAEAERLGARGVPASFVNGRYLSGAQPFSGFSALIDEELAVANKMIAEGTSRGEVYDALMKDARPEV